MNSTNWTLNDNQTLAEYVPLEDFKGILEQRIGISPDHVALLIRDGRLVETYNGAHFSIGGLWQKLKASIGGEHAIRLLVADVKPFQIESEIEGISRDQVPVSATAIIEYQLDPEKPQNILGLMHEQDILTRQDVNKRLMPHLRDRVFASVLNQVDAEQIRGNTPLQDKLQADIMLETERLFGDLGLIVRATSLIWGLNDKERAAMKERNRQSEQEELDREFLTRKRELERENDARAFVLRSDLAAEALKAAGEDKLRHMFLQQELGFADARESGVRSAQIQKLVHEIELLNIERQAAYTKALEDSENVVEQARLRKQLAEIDLQIEEMRTLQDLKLSRMKEEQDLHLAAQGRDQQIDAFSKISNVELDSESKIRTMDREDRVADNTMEIDRKRLEQEAEIEKVKIEATMSPDQILAVRAGLSPDVARIFSDRVRTEGLAADKQQLLLREIQELLKSNQANSEAQGRYYFEKALDGMLAARRGENEEQGTADKSNSTVECPNCQREVPASDKFCLHCGHRLGA